MFIIYNAKPWVTFRKTQLSIGMRLLFVVWKMSISGLLILLFVNGLRLWRQGECCEHGTANHRRTAVQAAGGYQRTESLSSGEHNASLVCRISDLSVQTDGRINQDTEASRPGNRCPVITSIDSGSEAFHSGNPRRIKRSPKRTFQARACVLSSARQSAALILGAIHG